MKVKNIPLELIKYSEVVLRKPEDMTGIFELAQDIRDNGLLNPLSVVEKEGYYELLAGGRRLEAVRSLGWEKVPCNILTPKGDREKIITLVENQKRADLNPLQEAQYYEYLVKELGIPQNKIAMLSGVSQGHVSNLLHLLDLDDYCMGALAAGDISHSQARELLRTGDIEYRKYLVDIIKKSGASVSMLRLWVDQRVGFQSKAVIYQAPPTPEQVEKAETYTIARCDVCEKEMEYGGLQTIMMCLDCYKKVKEAMGEGNVSQSGGEGK